MNDWKKQFDTEFAHLKPSEEQKKNQELGVLHYNDFDQIKEFIGQLIEEIKGGCVDEIREKYLSWSDDAFAHYIQQLSQKFSTNK